MVPGSIRCAIAAGLVSIVAIAPVSASPESEALSREGLRQLDAGDRKTAIRTFAEAARLDPTDGRAFFYLGIALNRAGQPHPALNALQEAVSLGAIHRDLLFEAGWAALETGRYSAAADFLEEFLEANPDRAKAHEFLGRSYIGLGRFDEAEAQLRRAVVLDPGLEPTTTFFLGQVAQRRGDLEGAARALNSIQNNAADSPVGRTLLDIRRETAPRRAAKPWALFTQAYVGSNSNVTTLSEDIVRPADITNTKSNYFGFLVGGTYRLKLDPTNAIIGGATFGHRNYRDIGGQDTHSLGVFGTYERIFAPRVRGLATVSYGHSRVSGDAFLKSVTVNPAVQLRINRRMQVELGYSVSKLNLPEPTATPGVLDRDSVLQSFGGRVIIAFPSLDSEVDVGVQRLQNRAQGRDYDYRGTAFALGVRTQLPWKLESSVRIQRTNYDYQNLNSLALTTTAPLTGFGATRQDSIDQVSLRLQRPVHDKANVYFQFTRSNANSNIPVFDYEQRDAQIGITARF